MGLEHWESYYRGGSLVSCPMGVEPYYTREVRDAWVSFFSALRDGARIVDLGTGNGAVALIARETAVAIGRRFEIHGVDLAHIDPVRDVPDGVRLLEGIRFHPGVSTTALPFDSGSIDAVSGQYAIEYTDIPASLAETARVLSRGGRCQLIMHHTESIIVRNAVESLAQARLVLEDTRVLRKFRRFCELEREAPGKAKAAHEGLRQAATQLRSAAAASATALLLDFVTDSLAALFEQRRAMSAAQQMKALAQVETNLRWWIRRLQDLASAALSPEAAARLVQTATGLGFVDPDLAVQMQDGQLVGWHLAMVKAGESSARPADSV